MVRFVPSTAGKTTNDPHLTATVPVLYIYFGLSRNTSKGLSMAPTTVSRAQQHGEESSGREAVPDLSETQKEHDRLLERALQEPGVAEVMTFWKRIRKTLPESPPTAALMVTSYATDANPVR